MLGLFWKRFLKVAAWNGVPDRHVKDVAQDGVVQVWKVRAKVDPKGNLNALGDRIVRNKVRDHKRAASRRREVLTPFDVDEAVDLRSSPEDHIRERERIELLWHLLDRVKPRYRDLLILHELEGLTLAQIAERKQIGIEAVKTGLRRAWEHLDQVKVHWQAEQRRRREDTRACVPLWLGLGARQGWETVKHTCNPTHLGQAAGILLLGHLVCAHQSSRRPGSPMSSGSSAIVASAATPATPIWDHEPAEAETTAAIEGDPREEWGTASTRTTADDFPALLGGKSAPIRPRTGFAAVSTTAAEKEARDAEEASLIRRARVAIESHSAAGDAAARQLLEEHARDFPEGRLTAERESLRRQLQ